MADVGKLILRLAVAILLGIHGISKLRSGIDWMAGPLQSHHLPAFIAYGVYIGEVLAPILLILGILTRLAALAIVIDLSMALFLVVGPKTFAISAKSGGLGGEMELLYIAAALGIVFLGSGRFALSKGKDRFD
jgi:putative oxidoreductase